jgi:soluble lytic murein transglycosylase
MLTLDISMRRLAMFLLLLPCAAQAQQVDIAQAIRTADWPTAQQAAAAYPDPIALKLVTFFRLQHPGDGQAAEIASFITQNPDWPAQATLLKRRDEALANEPDDSVALQQCTATPTLPAPHSGPALARCAQAAAAAGQTDNAEADARTAWVAGFPDADSEARFLARWHGVLTAADQLARFNALLNANSPAAASQAARLAPADEPLARARLAVRGNDPAAADLIAKLPADAREQPDLVLDQLRALRRANQDDAALALWIAHGFAAEARAGAAGSGAFWTERNQMARRRLQEGDNQGAFLLADDALQTAPEPAADAAFLAGYIALRKLHQPAVAAARFQILAGSSAAISQARAHYWLARAAADRGDPAAARSEYAAAAAWPTTYYGQLALIALGADAQALDTRIATLTDPVWTAQNALDFAGRELPRAAAMLVAWGAPDHARAFLQQTEALAADPVTRSIDAHFALGLGLPDQAVLAARRAGRDGTLLPQAGWPQPVDPPDGPAPPAVTLAIARQESSFDPAAVSLAGARGVMQLMPGTARQLAHETGADVPTASLTTDPAANMRLGSAYLAQLIDQYGGALPLAIAAYNAGPAHVDQWIADNGDPRGGDPNGQTATTMIDWIEMIPFSETRNYVQRVIENIAVYRAQRHETLPYPVST